MYPPHQRFYGKQWKKMDTQSAKMSQNAPFASFFSKIFSGRSPDPHPSCKGIFPNAYTPPYRSEVGLQPPPAVDQVSGSIIDGAMYFLMQSLLKIQLSLSEFKRLIYTPDWSFFQNFLGEAPNPHQRKGGPSRTLPTRPFRPREHPPGWVLDPPLKSQISLTVLII